MADFFRPVMDLEVSSLGMRHMPDAVAGLLPGLETGAQRAIQFTRSTPGISVALVGRSRAGHVRENLGVAAVPPARRQQYVKLYQ